MYMGCGHSQIRQVCAKPRYGKALRGLGYHPPPTKASSRNGRNGIGVADFLKDAGEKLFGTGEAKAAVDQVNAAPTAENRARLDRAAGEAIKAYIEKMGLSATALNVSFDGKRQPAWCQGPALIGDPRARPPVGRQRRRCRCCRGSAQRSQS